MPILGNRPIAIDSLNIHSKGIKSPSGNAKNTMESFTCFLDCGRMKPDWRTSGMFEAEEMVFDGNQSVRYQSRERTRSGKYDQHDEGIK